jgi:alkylated DNA repair dioxygenase AlkB
VPWQSSRLFRYDHVVEERRLGASWSRGNPLPHPALAEATRVLQHRYRVEFGGFTMLQYRDGSDGQAFHRDTDMRYLDDTIIAVLSLGAPRPWCLRPRSARHTSDPGRGSTHDLRPASGDLLVMGGRCQADWEHSVPYLGQPGAAGPRLSIQWRFARRQGRPFQGAGYGAPLHYSRDR